MTDDNPRFSRRTALKGLGTLAGASIVGGGSFLAATGGVAASSVSIDAANPAKLSNDRGELSQVTIAPTVTVNWSGLDDAVGKIFYLLEAKTASQSQFWPIFRATPWLDTDDMGPAGSYTIDMSGTPIVVADTDGRPDYSSWNWDSYSSASHSSYLDGTSLGSAANYKPGASSGLVPSDALGPQNNMPDIDAGYYGAAVAASEFNETTDGETKNTDVTIRYTFELLRPNVSEMQSKTGKTSSDPATLAADVAGVDASDIDVGNSAIVMNGEDGQFTFDDPSGNTYSELRTNASAAVGAITTTAGFTVPVENLPSSSGSTGSTGVKTN